MSVRLGLLAVLTSGPRHAYDLRSEFESRTARAWQLNMGQVTTTLASLVKAGLAEELPDASDRGAPRFAATARGREEVARWWATGTDRLTPAREETTIKLALAVTDPAVDVESVLQAQRLATMAALRDLTRLKPANVDDAADLAWDLTLDNMLFAAEAELRWLDHVAERMRRRPPRGRNSGAARTEPMSSGATESLQDESLPDGAAP